MRRGPVGAGRIEQGAGTASPAWVKHGGLRAVGRRCGGHGTPVRPGILGRRYVEERQRSTPPPGPSVRFFVTVRRRTRSPGHVSSHSPYGQSSLCTVQVLGGGNAGSSAHVRSLTAGLVARGVRVTVCAPCDADDGPTTSRARAPNTCPYRGAATRVRGGAARRLHGADLVHAHGLHASFRASSRSAAGAPRSSSPGTTARTPKAPAAVCCGCWSDASRGRPRSCSASPPTSSTGPAARGARDARLARWRCPAAGRASGRGGVRAAAPKAARRTRRDRPALAHGRRHPGPAPGLRPPAGRARARGATSIPPRWW